MRLLRNFIAGASKLMSLVGVFILAALILLSVVDALSRNLLGTGIPGIIEGTEAALVAIVYLALAGAFRAESHISADIALRYFPAPVQYWMTYLGTVIATVLMGFLCWFAWEGALHSVMIGEMRWGAVQMPIWPGKVALALGVTALMLELAVRSMDGPQHEHVMT